MIEKCTYCGCNRPHHDAMERAVSEKLELHVRFRRVLAQHGEQQARWEIEKISLQEGTKYLQRKVRSQASHLRKLEAKLRKQGVHPYVEDDSFKVVPMAGKVVQPPNPPEITGM